jgi:diketogulonate reductase-like aldo/keto reductase
MQEYSTSGRPRNPAQVAPAWLLTRGIEVVPVPGTKRVQRVEESTAADVQPSGEPARRPVNSSTTTVFWSAEPIMLAPRWAGWLLSSGTPTRGGRRLMIE